MNLIKSSNLYRDAYVPYLDCQMSVCVGVCMWPSSYKDGFDVMANISRHLHLAPALRPHAFGRAAQEFLQAADPCKTPFWILFGYNVAAKGWQQHYQLTECEGLPQFKRSADAFMRIAQQVDWTAWPELYRRILDGYRISFNVSKLLVAWKSIFFGGDTDSDVYQFLCFEFFKFRCVLHHSWCP